MKSAYYPWQISTVLIDNLSWHQVLYTAHAELLSIFLITRTNAKANSCNMKKPLDIICLLKALLMGNGRTLGPEGFLGHIGWRAVCPPLLILIIIRVPPPILAVVSEGAVNN